MQGPQIDRLSKEQLRKLYVEDADATMSSVARQLGCHRYTVSRWLKQYELPIKPRGPRKPRKPETQKLSDKEWLKGQLKIKPAIQIARDLGTAAHNVWYWSKKHGLNEGQSKSVAVKEGLRKKYPNGRYGKKAANWKGGRQVINGYVFVYTPDHPNARRNRIQEHRLVMEKELGRYLEPNEIVHHLDGDRQNNAPENLVVKVRGTCQRPL